MQRKRLLSAALCMLLLLATTACGTKKNSLPETKYPAAYITSAEQADTVNSLTRINEQGTFYQLEYTADYQLDKLLEADISDLAGLVGWVRSTLLSTGAEPAKANAGGACSAFAAANDDGELLFARNYDYVQNAQNILVHCRPEGENESVSIAAGGWLFTTDDAGNEIKLDDGKTDLSLLMAAPYLLMDGMNEKGVVICVLTVDGDGTVQQDPGKRRMQTTPAMRLVLDRAASVPEAIELLQQYNMNASIKVKNFHFFIADASGNYGIIEYSPTGEMKYSQTESGAYRNLFHETEPDYEERLVTNFYRLFPADEYGFDDGEHGLDRFEILSQALTDAKGYFNEDEAMDTLSLAYQDVGESATHETQWSVVYNPTDMTAKICPRVAATDQKDAFYATEYDFDFQAEFADTGAITYTAITK